MFISQKYSKYCNLSRFHINLFFIFFRVSYLSTAKGPYVDYSMLPYTSSDTANSHNIEEHQECINNLLYALQPLSNSVNKFVNEYYEHYFMKLNKLNWGPFAPKPFGISP